MKAIELFSGIGGMHFAVKEAQVEVEIVAAVDISDIPSRVYRFNFPQTKHMNKNVCGLSSKSFEDLEVDMILMSPPCQPYTRQGNQRDITDPRAQPLLHLIQILPEMKQLKCIFMENVKGFEISESRRLLLEALKVMDFHVQEFLLSPLQFGIPNSRLRYYLLAKKEKFSFPVREDIWTDTSDLNLPLGSYPGQVGDYLMEPDEQLLVSDGILLKYAEIMDIVNRDSNHSCCFTGAYGRYVQGTGSLLQQNGNLDDIFKMLKSCEEGKTKLGLLKQLKLRYFSPFEISKLMGFPEKSFNFPKDITSRQKYKVLGNSVNVHVISYLLQTLLK